jgi:hypothetical protein
VGDTVEACCKWRLRAVAGDTESESSVSKACGTQSSASSSVTLHWRMHGATERSVGLAVGDRLVVGAALGDSLGAQVSPVAVGVRVLGEALGDALVGERVGEWVGEAVVGVAVGDAVVGGALGEAVGDAELGEVVGAAVGESVVGDAVVGGAVGDAELGEVVGDTELGEEVVGDTVVGEAVGDVVVCKRCRRRPRWAVACGSSLTASLSHASHGGSTASRVKPCASSSLASAASSTFPFTSRNGSPATRTYQRPGGSSNTAASAARGACSGRSCTNQHSSASPAAVRSGESAHTFQPASPPT